MLHLENGEGLLLDIPRWQVQGGAGQSSSDLLCS